MVLGLGLSLAPIGAYLVVTGAFAPTPLFFSLSVLCWVSGFDIIYALQDEDFDRNEKLHSIPAWLGKVNALRLSTVLHVFSAIFIMMPVLYTHVGLLYYIGILFFCSMLIYQHTLVKPNDLSRVNIAFMTTNGIASVVFAAFFLLDRVWMRGRFDYTPQDCYAFHAAIETEIVPILRDQAAKRKSFRC
jgi:4-hydroxybenzoate polyprenyltransferase